VSITANYKGTCQVCQGTITPGSQVDKMPGGFGWRHADCEAPSQATTAPQSSPDDLRRAVAYLTHREPLGRLTSFEQSLLDQYRKVETLSHKQIDAVLKRIAEAEAKKMAPAGVNVDTSLPDVPEGKYALELQGGAVFFQVDRPRSGKWTGRTFVSELMGENHRPIKDPEQRKLVLEAIHQDVEGAARRYGHYRRECSFCDLSLTDPFSRFFGVGPVCRKKHGMPISRPAYIRRAREQDREDLVEALVAWEHEDPELSLLHASDPQLTLEA
jgi:hypothetical protein